MSKHDCGRELIARAVIIRDNALLVNRGTNARDGATYFALPGGHVDPGESCVQALQREIQEELEATIEVGALVFVAESVYGGRKAKSEATPRHELVLFFEGHLNSPLRENNGDVWSPEAKKRFVWLPLSEIAAANLYPATLKPLLQPNAANAPARLYSFHDTTLDSSATTSAPEATNPPDNIERNR